MTRRTNRKIHGRRFLEHTFANGGDLIRKQWKQLSYEAHAGQLKRQKCIRHVFYSMTSETAKEFPQFQKSAKSSCPTAIVKLKMECVPTIDFQAATDCERDTKDEIQSLTVVARAEFDSI
jgi:hypothetical protein